MADERQGDFLITLASDDDRPRQGTFLDVLFSLAVGFDDESVVFDRRFRTYAPDQSDSFHFELVTVDQSPMRHSI